MGRGGLYCSASPIPCLQHRYWQIVMGDEKPNRHDRQSSLPIPSYEEAIAFRPGSSQSFLGPTEVSHDPERQHLLEPDQGHDHVESRVHMDGEEAGEWFLREGGRSRISGGAERPDLLPMEMLEGSEDEASNENLSRGSRLSKRITSMKHNLSSFRFPLRRYLPSLERIRTQLEPGWIMVGRVFALLLVLVLAYLLFVSDILTLRRSNALGAVIDPESVRAIVKERINRTYIRQNAEYLTKFDHMAGTEGNYALAQWVRGAFDRAELEHVGFERFDVYLNYPKKGGRRVAITEPPEMSWEALIEEELAFTDPPREQTYAFHGHSRAGNVSGPLVYANYGSREDFARLKASGIDLQGAVILVRYYGSQGDRALKVKAAELVGAVGCIIYSDPAEDGFQKGKPFPDGRFMPSDGVQRGAVSLMSFIVGDVLSPGFASLPGERTRISKDDNPGLTNIPSIPLAWRDAQKLLQALRGHGLKLTGTWAGGVPDVEWWSGDHKSPIVNLMNEQDEVERQPIYNVLGSISGSEQPDKSIVVGNHRDAWCFGATDPGSGTAVFLEVVRIFGELQKSGWRPLRTIEFASWDGEEYNLIGSTEHVEARIKNLRYNGFAYLNVDVAVQGSDFRAAASPVFEQALLRVLDRTSDPVRNQTLRSIWDENNSKVQGLGAGSDYVAFQDMAGTSSIDLSFEGPPYDLRDRIWAYYANSRSDFPIIVATITSNG